MLKSVLIANRGEIACRVIRTARRLGLRTVAVYSEADRNALHVRLADEAVCIGPPAARESYLDGAKILAAARQHGCESIHPGYGFLSENADFARDCEAAGVVFIGPPATSIDRMGSKSEARRLMAAAGVPVLPGYDDEDQADARLLAATKQLRFPLLIKPTAGGGGKGMRIVRAAEEFAEALAGARREAAKSFGDDRVLLERFVEKGRHVEIQVFADAHGNAVHLYERDCSLQRRHQKVIEEAPAPGLSDATRAAMGQAAVAAAQAVGYRGAGTVEFLYDGTEFYFLEMNTRLQVEHPVTEMITGLDLVEWQLRVASGEPLPLTQAAIPRRGHAVEARLYAEDPERGFLPSTGRLTRLRFPRPGDDVRVDAGVEEGDEVTVHYDPMIAKLIVWAPDRTAAIDKLRQALEATTVDGVRTNARFLWQILGAPAVRAGDVSTRLLETDPTLAPAVLPREITEAWLIAAAARLHDLPGDSSGQAEHASSPWESASGFRLNGPASVRVALRLQTEGAPAAVAQSQPQQHWLAFQREPNGVTVVLDGTAHRLALHRSATGEITGTLDGQALHAHVETDHDCVTVRRHCLRFEFNEDTGAEHRVSAEHEGHFRAPMPGNVLDVRVEAGQTVAKGAVLLVLEAMKMEHSITAPWAARVTEVKAQKGQKVEEGADLIRLEPAE
ncbi:MAG: acetyl/propionyl/methylcrotonyl-CoA carboxylase subunit alpha [Gammaproteobacteria bacterium]|nr:acetyl/propionyl/methylcrotonyl-CoA carboxylase subunit alpha [Gammaproteobacteria bacterium]MDH5176609.1 acetyl/propionyl/methylcrotonyl-CoA carboxylase subunit alpha [Gammaproteobacteria bacterium]MDH5226587.1 acetyl/propionyl/methylcrotonyl-CoA carboxylase subunit alpha [Gammaproteobacteria bacterium]